MHLLKYSEVIKELGQKFGINALNYYDRNFRLLREQIPAIRFSDIHSELWIRATAFSVNSFTPTKNRPLPRYNRNVIQLRGACYTINSLPPNQSYTITIIAYMTTLNRSLPCFIRSFGQEELQVPSTNHPSNLHLLPFGGASQERNGQDPYNPRPVLPPRGPYHSKLIYPPRA